jgi:hypothetical protein
MRSARSAEDVDVARKKLGANDLLLLQALARGPAQVENLQLEMSASSRYYSAAKLVELGHATHDVHLGQHSIRPSGEKILSERGLLDRAPRSKPRILPDDVWSRLSALSEEHVRFLELVLCAVSIRWHRVYGTNLPTFAVLGEPQGGKSTVLKLAVALAGGVKGDFIYLPKEKGQSLTVRVDARGERVSKREVLDHPVFGGDELLKVKRQEIKDAVKYQFGYGESVLSDENGELEFRCTPVLSMNPHRAGTDLESRTGFSEDEGEQRRTIFLDLTRVPISDGFLIAGQDILKAIEPLCPKEPPSPAKPYADSRKRVVKTLRKILPVDRRRRLQGIDVILISQLVVGATAYGLSHEEAFRAVIWAWATVVSLLGWLVSEWRTILEVEFSKERGAGDEEAEEVETEIDSDEITRLKASWESAIKRIVTAGYSAEEVDRLVAIDEQLKADGSSSERAFELDCTRRDRRFNLAQAQNALGLRREAEDAGLRLPDLRSLVRELAADLAQAPEGPSLAARVHEIVEEHGSLVASIEKLRAKEAEARADSKRAWNDNASVRRFFREVVRTQKRIRCDAQLRPLITRIDNVLGEWVRATASQDAAAEAYRELESLFHWLETCRMQTEAMRNDPELKELVQRVDQIVERETLASIMDWVDARDRARDERRAERQKGAL